MPQKYITPAQCRAARALLDWSQQDLAAASEVSASTLKLFETSKNTTQPRIVEALAVALERAGVEFLEDDGVRRRKAV